MDKSFQDYSSIGKFEAKVSIKTLKKADYNSFSDSFSVYLKTIDHLNSKLFIFCMHTASLKM